MSHMQHKTTSINSNNIQLQQIHKQPQQQLQHDAKDPTHTNQPLTTTTTTKFVHLQPINQQPQLQHHAKDPTRTNQPTTATTTTKFVESTNNHNSNFYNTILEDSVLERKEQIPERKQIPQRKRIPQTLWHHRTRYHTFLLQLCGSVERSKRVPLNADSSLLPSLTRFKVLGIPESCCWAKCTKGATTPC
jgi:hypothetical protein